MTKQGLRVGIHGAAGRMGQRLIALGNDDPALTIVAAIENAAHPKLGQDAGTIAGISSIGVPLTADFPSDLEVVIDFSVPQAMNRVVGECLKHQIPLVVATTGLEPEQQKQIKTASHQIPILWSPSMSMAVNLLMKLAGTAAGVLKGNASGVDVEIIEKHHRFKEDAPSGTALKFGEIISQVMGLDTQTHGREGRPGKRPTNEIGYHAVRVGDNPGEHTIIFGMLGETIELTVKASNRDCYAHGALAAAKFIAGKEAGLYGINDVLGLA